MISFWKSCQFEFSINSLSKTIANLCKIRKSFEIVWNWNFNIFCSEFKSFAFNYNLLFQSIALNFNRLLKIFLFLTQLNTDERLRRINELLLGIKIIKLNAWETVFAEKIQKSRENELKCLDKDSIYWTLMSEYATIFEINISFHLIKNVINFFSISHAFVIGNHNICNICCIFIDRK